MTIENAYCSEDDIYTYLEARAFEVRPRPVPTADVDGPTGTIRLKAHGLTVDDLLTFEVTSGGALPTGITAFATQYPIIVSFDLLRVAASFGGVAQAFASVGSGWGIVVDARRRLHKHAVDAAAVLNQHLTAHGVPVPQDEITGAFPPLLVGLNARMAGRAAVTSLQISNAAYRVAVDRLFAQEEFDRQMLDRLSREGWPVRPTPGAPATQANLAAFWGDASRGWDGGNPGVLP